MSRHSATYRSGAFVVQGWVYRDSLGKWCKAFAPYDAVEPITVQPA